MIYIISYRWFNFSSCESSFLAFLNIKIKDNFFLRHNNADIVDPDLILQFETTEYCVIVLFTYTFFNDESAFNFLIQ